MEELYWPAQITHLNPIKDLLEELKQSPLSLSDLTDVLLDDWTKSSIELNLVESLYRKVESSIVNKRCIVCFLLKFSR